MPTHILPQTSARFRLMVVDLDSVVSAAGSLNPTDAAALRAAHAAGIKVVLASARSPQAIHRYWAQLGLGTPVVAFDGALVYDFPGRKPLLGQPLDGKLLAQLLHDTALGAPKATVVLETADGWIANRIGSFARSIIEQTGNWPSISPDLSAGLPYPVYRMTVEAAGATLSTLRAALPAAGLVCREGNAGWLQLTSDAAGREWALSALAGIEEVSLDEVVVIGGRAGEGARLDAAALAALMANAVAGAGLLASEPESSITYGDGGDTPGELTPAGSEDDLWPTIER
ncbi:MAG: HAD hydrolase family protein [Caldilineales bacterium]